MASYPSAIKSWPQYQDGVDTIFAQHMNERGDEITSIETELGLLPKGPDTDVYTRLNRGPVTKQLTNKSGGTRSANDLIIMDSSNDSSFTTTTTQSDKKSFGVVLQSINSNAAGYVQIGGIVTIKVQGNVTRGNYLRSSATQAAAEDAGTVLVDGIFARALTSYGGGGAGSVVAMLFGSTLETVQSIGTLAGSVSVTDSNSGTVSGLNGNTDHHYTIIMRGFITAVNSGADGMQLLPNGTANNHRMYKQERGDTTIADTLYTNQGIRLQSGFALNDDFFAIAWMSTRTNSDQFKAVQPFHGRCKIGNGSAVRFGDFFGCYSVSTNVTSFQLVAETSSRWTGKMWVYKPGNP